MKMTMEELMGKSDQDLFPVDAASSFEWEEEQVLRSGQSSINREERITAPDGRQRWNLTTKVPLRDKRSNIIGLVGINRDITERKRVIGEFPPHDHGILKTIRNCCSRRKGP